MRKIERGRIQAADLGRQFRIATGGGRSLKATLLRREAPAIHEFWALRHVDVEIEPGETFGIVGRNGSGKSTFLKLLARIYGPSEGHCAVGGRMSSLIELGAGFHPEFNAIENVFLAGAVYGIPKRELERDLDEIIGFAELDAFAYQPIKTYSSGMFMRLGFSVAMHVRPDVLLLDEILAVGDERFVQKCLSRIAQFRREGGTMLLVTHDPTTVERLCQRAMLLSNGTVTAVGLPHDVLATYHRQLSEQPGEDNAQEPHVQRDRHFAVETNVTDASGTSKHQFEEGSGFVVDLAIEAEADAYARLSLSFHDELGREVGGRVLDGVAFAGGTRRNVRFVATGAPLRSGLFQIRLHIVDADSGATLFEAPALETISVYGDSAAATGPVLIDGAWVTAD